MTQNEAKILERYYDEGCVVLIGGSGYVDSAIYGIYYCEEAEEYVYDSEVFSERPLAEVMFYDVIVARPIRHLESDYSPSDGYTYDDDKEVTHIDGKGI